MTVMTTPAGLPFGRPLTRADLAGVPDDGHRYELIDGSLIVTPAPSGEHQGVALELAVVLRSACPPDHRLVIAPFAVALDERTELHPDLLVARAADLTSASLPGAPVLAIEVLSPSTRRVDLVLKRDRLQSAGCAHYWVVDPLAARLVAWELRDGAYVEVADVTGEDLVALEHPFPVRFRPASLTRWRGADEET